MVLSEADAFVKVKDIINKMCDQSPHSLFRNYVFLSAFLAISAGNSGTAVQTIFIQAFWLMWQVKFFLKIVTNTALCRKHPLHSKPLAIFDANNILMKTFIAVAVLLFSIKSPAQYFYKDIIGTRESAELINSYKNNKVRTVALNSYTINNTPINNFSIPYMYIFKN